MRKLLSLSLAIVMMLSCVLGQAVLVSAADAVDSNNAPYAGVYQVISDKAVTLTNETGHVVTLAADVADYFYLIKGANKITTTDDSANVTFTALADNGMAYINKVAVDDSVNLITTSDAATLGSFGTTQFANMVAAIVSTEGSVTLGSNDFYLGAGGSVTLKVTATEAGLYYMATLTNSHIKNLKVSSDTGFYGTYGETVDSMSYFEDGSNDLILLYLREGDNYITYSNEGTAAGSITYLSVSNTNGVNNATFSAQLNMGGVKVTPYVAPVEPTQSPAPTEEPVVTPAPADSMTYTAPYAGVYEVTSDKTVTLTNETGHVVTLEADVADYFYLIQGVNKIATTDTTANLVFTALENNGMAYINEVNEGTPDLITTNDAAKLGYLASGSFDNMVAAVVNSQGDVTLGTNDVWLGADASVTFNVTAAQAGLYYVGVYTPTAFKNLKVSTDTGFYGLYNETTTGVSYFEDGANDLVLLYLREGANLVTCTNEGDVTGLLACFVLSNSNGVNNDAYKAQLYMGGLRVTPYVAAEESFVNNQTANFADGALTFAGKVGADYLDLDYGVEIGDKKFYGAKDGDIVSDGAEGTRVFTFGDWDGSFEIILTNITVKGTAGDKTYKFFVGENYTAEATVTVE